MTAIRIFILWIMCASTALAGEGRFPTYGEELRWLELTDKYLQEGRLDLAEQHLDEFLDKNGLNEDALILRARVHQARQQWERSETVLRKAMQLHRSPAASDLLRGALAQLGRWKDVKELQELSPEAERSISYESGAKELLSTMNAQNAAQVLSELTEKHAALQGEATYWVLRVRALSLLKRPREALTALKNALALEPDLEMVRMEAAKFWEHRGQLNRAAEHLSYLVATHPENAKAAYHLVRIQLRKGRSDIALRILRARQYLFPEEAWVKQARAGIQTAVERSEIVPLGPCRYHSVTTGDTLEALSRRYLGDPARWQELWRSNRDILKDPNTLTVGIGLRICSRS